ncbi:MAG TPA: hypothetical protein VEB22_09390, partial [Phycisphaerales bacterium]|nr:hypothetical protein [Phycisphaerales bacterium]
MHDPHDDPLERELQALSSYTGSPPEPPLWQTALEMHRAEQQRRLWVWVRRPMPAVAAAALAVLVAAVALDPVANLRGRVVHTSDLSDTALDAARFRHADGAAGPGATRTGGPASGAAGVRLDTVNDKLEPVSRTVNPSPPAAVDPAPAAQPDTLRSGRDQPRRVDRAAGGGGAPSPVDAAPKKEAGDSPNTPADLAAGRGPDAAPRPAAPAAPPSPAPAPSGSAGTPNVDKVGNRRVNDFGERAGTNAEFFSNEPYEVAANIRLGVNDISTFYNVIPRLVDVKSGETYSNSAIPNEPLPGNAPLNAEVLNVQLRVNEQRLPEVIEELRKTGNLQIESSQVPPKEDRLKQIESALKQQEVEVKAVMAESKSKSDSKTYKGERPEKAEDGAAVLQQKAQQRLSMLNSQRARIEQGADFAYVNIQAVSEQQQA